MKKLFLLLRRINCLLCDWALAYLLLYLFLYIKPSQLSLVSSYFLVLSIYYLITMAIFKRSLFQFILRLEIQTKTHVYFLIKVLFIGIIPFFLISRYWVISFVLYELLLVVLGIIMALCTQKSIWQLFARATVAKESSVMYVKPRVYYALGLITLSVFCFLDVRCTVFQERNVSDRNMFQTLTNDKYAIPLCSMEAKRYANHINMVKQDHVKFLYNLFAEKDIVIISERMHPEYTQWDLFSQIILSDDFANKIGNVCTEFGRVNNQHDLEHYLSTPFDSEEELKKATADLVRENGGMWPLWCNKNIYDFIQNLHKFNAQRDKEGKINLFFSDEAAIWDTITNRLQWKSANYRSLHRDSIMAENTMSVYKKLVADNSDRKKILVIQNTRHAYKSNTHKLDATADYIFKTFPTQTANVYMNSVSLLFIPAKAGVWDAAALQIKDSVWAINFNESILGNDYFDMHQGMMGKRYKDVFDGMIYYKHPKDFIFVESYEYMLDDFKDTLLKRSAMVGDDYLNKTQVQIKLHESNNLPIIYEQKSVKIFNLFYSLFHFLISLFLFINLIGPLVRSVCTKIVMHESA